MKPIFLHITDKKVIELTEEQVKEIQRQLFSRSQSKRAHKRWEKYRNITSGTHISKA